MVDEFEHVSAGQDLDIRAPTWNAMLDAANATRKGGPPDKRTRPEPWKKSGTVVKVRNDSGSAVGRYGVLVVDEPVFLPSDSVTGFKTYLVLSCLASSSSGVGEDGKFVVLLEPLADGQIGAAIISGVVQVQIELIDEAHEFADVAPGETGYLESRASGSAKILWSEGGTGVAWAIVRLSNPVEPAPKYVGEIWLWGGTIATIPDGNLFCDNGEYDTTVYAELFAAIAYTHGGAGATFKVPNGDGRFAQGAESDAIEHDVHPGDVGGYTWHGMTENNHPDHDLGHVHYGSCIALVVGPDGKCWNFDEPSSEPEWTGADDLPASIPPTHGSGVDPNMAEHMGPFEPPGSSGPEFTDTDNRPRNFAGVWCIYAGV